ncbi:NAD-dependent succinate-semialdehyde dehydrogenase [Acetobacter sp. AN02]|uniref:NAD-dependent succinate-semialdehyde dehydrogenase n=1 Tax=Acetobacter sp. AN02 TaxID=2894186 RepID=UPI0024346613|nr:NAD-dependent succinate-semialdehyde dehydrogenase [Acetobacter sp. AN02]MDG6095216.1 NAD-dependent succinate-semialdehyde dehydrogenase [Acetobacter sp. AN02]
MQLQDTSLFREAVLVGGQWIDAKTAEKTIAVEDPATGRVIGHVPDLGQSETRQAVEAAAKAQKIWAKVSAAERADKVRRWYELIMASQDDLARIMTLEQGKPLEEARGEIAYGASFVLWFAEEARRMYGEIIPPPEAETRMMVIRQPVGVTAAITPWNFPNAMITRKAAPAFAAGCAMVLKPPEQTPFSAIALAILAERAGFPSGLFSVVTGDAAAIGGEMTSNPTVRKLTFTGSTRIGALLYEQCAPTIKKLGLELGGNAPLLVFDDADLEVAVEEAVAAKFRNNGQTCVCANRLYVQAGIYDAFAERLAERLGHMKTGNGFDEGVTFGPLINKAALKKVQDHIEDAVSHGAKIIAGGKPHELGGLFFEPTILTEVTAEMKVAREETFGPLAPLFRFETEEEAIERANDTEFGLASYVFTSDVNRVFRVSEALESGMVGVNTGHISHAEAPFGGIRSSGLGREGSRHGLEDFTELKFICLGNVK